jgi:hypothetical protein
MQTVELPSWLLDHMAAIIVIAICPSSPGILIPCLPILLRGYVSRTRRRRPGCVGVFAFGCQVAFTATGASGWRRGHRCSFIGSGLCGGGCAEDAVSLVSHESKYGGSRGALEDVL